MYQRTEQSQERSTPRDVSRSDDAYDTLSSVVTTTNYRSVLSPRVTTVQRSRGTGLGAAGVSTRFYQGYGASSGNNNFGSSLASLVNASGVPLRGGNTAVVSINTSRQRDKRDLEILNDKFAQYVEKVRFLEAHNRKLELELQALRSRSGL